MKIQGERFFLQYENIFFQVSRFLQEHMTCHQENNAFLLEEDQFSFLDGKDTLRMEAGGFLLED